MPILQRRPFLQASFARNLPAATLDMQILKLKHLQTVKNIGALLKPPPVFLRGITCLELPLSLYSHSLEIRRFSQEVVVFPTLAMVFG